jgi:hypothetical protein
MANLLKKGRDDVGTAAPGCTAEPTFARVFVGANITSPVGAVFAKQKL